jgi:hypothetical protein
MLQYLPLDRLCPTNVAILDAIKPTNALTKPTENMNAELIQLIAGMTTEQIRSLAEILQEDVAQLEKYILMLCPDHLQLYFEYASSERPSQLGHN